MNESSDNMSLTNMTGEPTSDDRDAAIVVDVEVGVAGDSGSSSEHDDNINSTHHLLLDQTDDSQEEQQEPVGNTDSAKQVHQAEGDDQNKPTRSSNTFDVTTAAAAAAAVDDSKDSAATDNVDDEKALARWSEYILELTAVNQDNMNHQQNDYFTHNQNVSKTTTRTAEAEQNNDATSVPLSTETVRCGDPQQSIVDHLSSLSPTEKHDLQTNTEYILHLTNNREENGSDYRYGLQTEQGSEEEEGDDFDEQQRDNATETMHDDIGFTSLAQAITTKNQEITSADPTPLPRPDPLPGAYAIPGTSNAPEPDDDTAEENLDIVPPPPPNSLPVLSAQTFDEAAQAERERRLQEREQNVQTVMEAQLGTIVRATEVDEDLGDKEPVSTRSGFKCYIIPPCITSRRVLATIGSVIIVTVIGVAVGISLSSGGGEGDDSDTAAVSDSPSQTLINSTSSHPTSSLTPIGFKCFNSTRDLQDAVDIIFSGDNERRSQVEELYGPAMTDWCVSKITDFSWLFSADRNSNMSTFNEDISTWDMSSASNTSGMFYNAEYFTQDVSSWNVSAVADMSSMFSFARAFNQALNDWNVSSVTNMSYMFSDAYAFNQPLNDWNVLSVTNMSHMFSHAEAFNQLLDSWNVSSATDLSGMFRYTATFNNPLGAWDVSSVTDLGDMFYAAEAFDQPLNAWDVSSVTDMSGMFTKPPVVWSIFNQPLDAWNVSSVTNLYRMFYGAKAFNQSLCSWGSLLPKNVIVDDMFGAANCPLWDDPDLQADTPGPFCHGCSS